MSDSLCKGSNTPYISSLAVDEKKMRQDHWLGLVLCVPFSALNLWCQ